MIAARISVQDALRVATAAMGVLVALGVVLVLVAFLRRASADGGPHGRDAYLRRHLLPVVAGVILLGVVAVEAVVGRLGQPVTYRMPLVLAGNAAILWSLGPLWRLERGPRPRRDP